MKQESLLAAAPTARPANVCAAPATGLVNSAGASRVALAGYDPVSFFTNAQPVHGDPGVTAEHNGATYFFATPENRSSFVASPDRYLPQFGGFCAFGASVGALFPVDLSTWQLIDGKLYIVLNPVIRQAFDLDRAAVLAKAATNWPRLVRDHAN